MGSRALRWGLWAALLFVGLRVVYRVLFGSTVAPPGDAVLILDLPAIPLAGPFSGIVLLGSFTLEQLFATLSEASRFAVVFVVFGAANALADARTLLARVPKPMLPVATVLALALGTVPALLAAAQRVSWAARLRGERRGPRLLVPVFEQAVERATTLGASMELRGYAAQQSVARLTDPSTDPSTDPALLKVEGLRVTHRGQARGGAVLSTVSLEVRAGELTVITGPTGSGKSTLLQTLAGLAPAYTGGEASGVLTVGGLPVLGPGAPGELRPAHLSGSVALVPQRVEHSFLAETVRAELAFAPTRRGMDERETAAGVNAALARFQLGALAERDPTTLSAGESTRAALAAATLTSPRVLLLDEPIADLDPASTAVLLGAVRELLAEGCGVIVAEHRPEALTALEGDAPIQWFELRAGSLALSVAPPPPATAWVPNAAGDASAPQSADTRADATAATELMRDRAIQRGGRQVLEVSELTVNPGTITMLTGPNGTGKTTLLEEIALPSDRATRAAGVALVPFRVDDLLVRDTVAEECRFADRRAGAAPGSTAARFTELITGSIPQQAQGELRRRHPRDLSAGTRLALGIAVQLAHTPRVLLLDEPTRGLDLEARRRLAGLLGGIAADSTAILFATHDLAFGDLLREAGATLHRREIIEGVLR